MSLLFYGYVGCAALFCVGGYLFGTVLAGLPVPIGGPAAGAVGTALFLATLNIVAFVYMDLNGGRAPTADDLEGFDE